MDVSIRLAGLDDRPLIEGLFQLYFHDFSEFYPGENWDIGGDGRYAPYPGLGDYWRESDHRPFLIEASGHVAGFALINAHSYRGARIDHAMAEFFVMRQYRRSGVGEAAARAIFNAHPGDWELAIAAPNAGARAFWPRAILRTPDVGALTMVRVEDRDRTIVSFVVA